MGLEVLEIIQEIHREKKEKRVEPHFATRAEVRSRIMDKLREDLQQLVDDGVVKVGNTLNDLYFELNNEEDEQ